MHILFLTDNFPPEVNAPATRTFEHTREWLKHGHKITIITCAPNFPNGTVFDSYENKWFFREEIEGLDVRRVKTFITSNEGFFKRTLDFLSFMISSFIAGLFVKKIDVVIGTSPQFFTVCSAWALAKLRRKPFIFELRDIWPASITAVGISKPGIMISLLEKLELFLYRQSDLIVTVTESFKLELIERGIEAEKISVILNGVDLSRYSPNTSKDNDLEKKLGIRNKFVLGYLGTHGLSHALEKALDAAKILESNSQIVFLFVGGGAFKAELNELIEEYGLKNVVSIPSQPKEEMPKIWTLCDVALVSLKNVKLFQSVIPSKIFESMGVGKPIIISAPKGEATRIIMKTKSGIVVSPEAPSELAEAVELLQKDDDLRHDLSKCSAEAAQLYSRKTLARNMLTEIEALVKRGHIEL